MLRILLNNTQREKYATLDYVLNPANKETIENLPHRIKALNEDLEICEIPLKINNNLTYSFTEEIHDRFLKSYYKKTILYVYKNYLLTQSNIFHLVKYLIANDEPAVEDIVYSLSISTSYIYKLIGNFNKESAEKFGVTIRINKKSVNFYGDANKIMALTFQFCKFFPSGHLVTLNKFLNNKIDDEIIDPLRPYLLKIYKKDDVCSNIELIYSMFTSIYVEKPTNDELKLIGYELVQQGGDLVKFCHKLISYYSRNYPQIKIEYMTFYLVELIKLIILIEVSPEELLLTMSDQATLKKYKNMIAKEKSELLLLLSKSNLSLKMSTIETLLLVIKPCLEKSKMIKTISVYVEIMDSIFITELFGQAISQVFNSNKVMLSTDMSEANIIVTDNPDTISFKNEDTFIYLISDVMTEFDNKNYLKFILSVLSIFASSSEEDIIKNANLLRPSL